MGDGNTRRLPCRPVYVCGGGGGGGEVKSIHHNKQLDYLRIVECKCTVYTL